MTKARYVKRRAAHPADKEHEKLFARSHQVFRMKRANFGCFRTCIHQVVEAIDESANCVLPANRFKVSCRLTGLFCLDWNQSSIAFTSRYSSSPYLPSSLPLPD